MPSTPAAFSTLPLAPELLTTLSELGYEAMTPVQAQSLPALLAGRDVIAQAMTGSGKTAAFGIALLTRLDARCFEPQALILCPTRELADQVTNGRALGTDHDLLENTATCCTRLAMRERESRSSLW